MAKLFIAQPLDNLLRVWEDCNIYAEFFFQMRFIAKEEFSIDLSASIGSEITPLGILGRSIPDYEKLRKILMGVPYTHETNFMPRIPKAKRDLFNNFQEAFNDLGFILPPLQIPRYLLKWNETRKACIVEDSIPIPLVDLRNENWLSKLPYKSFFLRVSSPFVFPKSKDNEEESVMDTFLIYEDVHSIRVLGWSHKNEEKNLFTDAERKKILEDTGRLKKRKRIKEKYASKKLYGWFMVNFTILKDTSEPIVHLFDQDNQEIFACNIYDPKYDQYQYRAILEVINGFCKLMTSLPKAPSIKAEETNSVREKTLPPRQWFELPEQTIDYFQTEKGNNTVIIKRAYGSEKGPHIRRAHPRRMVGNDGKVTEIWIEQTYVREDKLLTQQLQGGAIAIK